MTDKIKLETLTAKMDDYFWHAGADLEVRWKEAQRRLPARTLRSLVTKMRQLETVADVTNQEVRAAQIAAIGRQLSATDLLDHALASLEHLNELTLALSRRLDQILDM